MPPLFTITVSKTKIVYLQMYLDQYVQLFGNEIYNKYANKRRVSI